MIFNAPELPANQLILGDNLEVLRTLPSEYIDLLYIDLPFFSGRNYNVIWGDTNEVRSFYDIWEGGIDSYLIWLNARLWEMRRVLKKTGSIYVHCDWHASHYIKTEMDKIFGYENFRNEIVWKYRRWTGSSENFLRMHDVILFYTKIDKYTFNPLWTEYTEESKFRKKHFHTRIKGNDVYVTSVNPKGVKENDVWEISVINSQAKERIGYPTQKPIELMQQIIDVSSKPGDSVADFFCGGGSFLAAAMGARAVRDEGISTGIRYEYRGKEVRRFIGCDSSRVAISVTLDRLVKIGEEKSGVRSNISTKDEAFQFQLQTKGITERVPNIEVSYLGVYPIDKFTNLDQDSFVNFVLTCYGASHNTAEGVTSGFRPNGQQEPILVGPANPNDSIDAQTVRAFFDEIKSRLEPNKLVRAKIIGLAIQSSGGGIH